MRDIDKDYPTLDVFDAIHRELVTIIGHCTFHRSLLQDLLLQRAHEDSAPVEALERWRQESLHSVEQLRFSDLNKQDKALATAVYEEASKISESFWNVLLSRAEEREPVTQEAACVAPVDEATGAAGESTGARSGVG